MTYRDANQPVSVLVGPEPSRSALRRVWSDADIRFIDGRTCIDRESLFGECRRALEFPDYFGWNWDSFEECVQDLSWITSNHVALVVLDADGLLPTDDSGFETLISILNRAATARYVEPHFPNTGPKAFSVGLHVRRESLELLKTRTSRVDDLVELATVNIPGLP
jgi:RNAse (barnase) inhibitor barstar